MTRIWLAMLLGALVAGCAPQWHNGNIRMMHRFDRAAVYGDSLCLQGSIAPIQTVTDYGFRVNDVRANSGTSLRFRSYQIFWMKELRFEAAFEAPEPTATAVHVDVEFLSRSGTQRVQTVLPVERDARDDYRSQLQRWEERESIE